MSDFLMDEVEAATDAVQPAPAAELPADVMMNGLPDAPPVALKQAFNGRLNKAASLAGKRKENGAAAPAAAAPASKRGKASSSAAPAEPAPRPEGPLLTRARALWQTEPWLVATELKEDDKVANAALLKLAIEVGMIQAETKTVSLTLAAEILGTLRQYSPEQAAKFAPALFGHSSNGLPPSSSSS